MCSESLLKYTLFQFLEIRQCYNEVMFLDALAQAAGERCGLSYDEPVLIGVSGGVDSLALLLGLEKLGYKLVVAHLDHALRAESAEDAAFVKSLADARGLPYVSARVDVKQHAKNQGQSLEEAARDVRYNFLFNQARRHHAQAVAVGHHADDQVETVLMHLLRGAGLSGLSGMSYRRTLANWDKATPLVRPLLGIWKAEIEAFVADAGLRPCEDATNRDLTYFRNRLRHALLPELATYNPKIRKVLSRMASVLGEEDRYLEALANDAWAACFMSESKSLVQLSRQSFLKQPAALQRRLLRRAIAQLRPALRDIGFDAVERGLAFAQTPSESGEIDLVARLNLAVVGDRLILKTWDADLPDWGKPLLTSESQVAWLDIKNPVGLQHGWRIEAEVLDAIPEEPLNTLREMGPNEVWLDAERLCLPLTVRGRAAGERWQPLGMLEHTQSLQDFFINEKVPAHLREIWPLVCSGGEVAWVLGLRPSEAFKVGEDTQRVMRLKVVRKAPE
jgi:tRNA(Ile)-lysidine synthase